MPTIIKKVYWDACAWISLIQNEVVDLDDGSKEFRGRMCRAVIDAAEAGKIEIFTSAFALAEVNKPSALNEINTSDKLADFFENDFIIVVELDRYSGEYARRLMQAGLAGLKPPDATHLASAALAQVDEMHTFDRKLLDLDNKIDKADGTKLRIRQPSLAVAPAPLLDLVADATEVMNEAEAEQPFTEEELEALNARISADDVIIVAQEDLERSDGQPETTNS